MKQEPTFKRISSPAVCRTLRRRMFMINTTTYFHQLKNRWNLTQIPQILSGDFGWRVVLGLKEPREARSVHYCTGQCSWKYLQESWQCKLTSRHQLQCSPSCPAARNYVLKVSSLSFRQRERAGADQAASRQVTSQLQESTSH